MARKKTNGAAGVGDNSQAEAEMLVLHMTRLRQKNVVVEEAKAALKAEQDEMTALFRAAKVDGFSRKELTELLVDTGARLRNILAEEERRFRLRTILGLPVFGEQQEFSFGNSATPTMAKDELFWEAEGYLNGRRGSMAGVPDDCPPTFLQAWSRGDERGQKENGALFVAGQERVAKAGQPDAETPAVDLTPDPEKVAADARKLKKSGWADKPAGAPKLEVVN